MRHPLLRHLYETLLAPLQPGQPWEGDLARLHLVWAGPDSPELDTALGLVRYSYGRRFLPDESTLPAEAVALGPAHGHNSRTLLALQEYGGGLLPVGTLTVGSGADLDLFELFEPGAGAAWVHAQPPDGPSLPGEVCRFALHPLFDLLDAAADRPTRQLVDFYRRLILRRLTGYCLDWLIAQDITVAYCVVGPHMRLFMRRAGMLVIPVDGVRPRPSEPVTRLRRQFARYWQPDAAPSHQPVPCRLTGIIRPVAELPDLPPTWRDAADVRSGIMEA
jgi:hypothetical protein